MLLRHSPPARVGKIPRARYTAGMKPIRPLIFLALGLTALVASAQWQWTDKDGRKVFSDRAPPSDVPEKNILKRPAGSVAAARAVPPAATPEAAAAPATPAAAAGSGVDKALMEKKKQAEAAEAAKRKAEEERTASLMAENCNRARQAKVAFDSGARINRVNERGEREIMDEAAMAAESQRLQGIMNENCR